MLTHNMILVLATNGGSLATKLAQNKSVKKATAKQLDAVVGNLALSVSGRNGSAEAARRQSQEPPLGRPGGPTDHRRHL